jgi:hypothetical protein
VGGGEIFRACPDRPWDSPSLLYNGYRVFPGGKVQPGSAADHSPSTSAEVMEEYIYISTHPLGHTGPVTELLYLYLIAQNLEFKDQACIFKVHREEVLYSESANTATARTSELLHSTEVASNFYYQYNGCYTKRLKHKTLTDQKLKNCANSILSFK